MLYRTINKFKPSECYPVNRPGLTEKDRQLK